MGLDQFGPLIGHGLACLRTNKTHSGRSDQACFLPCRRGDITRLVLVLSGKSASAVSATGYGCLCLMPSQLQLPLKAGSVLILLLG